MPTSRDLSHLPEHELLRRFVRLRDAGDEAADAHWEALVVKSFDRVKQQVKLFRFPGGVGLRAEQRDDAIQEAFLRMKAMTFREAHINQFLAALKTCVWNTCMDYGRSEMAYERRIGGSLDAPAYEDGDRGRYDDALEHEARARDADSHDKLEEEAYLQRTEALLEWGIAKVGNDNYREVLELTLLQKLDGGTIATKLNITAANVYQRRLRGMKRLEEVLSGPRA